MGDCQRYRVRTCQTLLECAVCGGRILLGQTYHDGGYGRRAHTDCVSSPPATKPEPCRWCGGDGSTCVRNEGSARLLLVTHDGTREHTLCLAEAYGRDENEAEDYLRAQVPELGRLIMAARDGR